MRNLLVSGLLLFFAFGAFGQKNSINEFVNPDQIAAHMKFIASDELAGRKTGEPGNNIAAKYIAEQFRRIGLEPAMEDSYLQKVPFSKSPKITNGSLEVNGMTYQQGDEIVFSGGKELDIETEIIYAGHGIIDEGKGVNDYENLDVKGKIVMVQGGTGEQASPFATLGLTAKKEKFAREKGAVAIIQIFNMRLPWNVIKRFTGGERLRLVEDLSNITTTNENIPQAWINLDKEVIGEWQSSQDLKGKIKFSGVVPEIIYSNNVLGIIEGTDENLKDEFILVSAHYDHVGTRNRTPEEIESGLEVDTIFNGCRDNAFGTVSVLTTAEYLMKNRPKRSVLVAAWTAEEIGLLGAKFFASNPTLDLSQVVFNLNSDGGGYTDTTKISFLGYDRVGMKANFEKACSAFGLTSVADPAPQQNLFDRSDNVVFAKLGIPAPTISPGFTEFNEELTKYYHKEADNPDNISYGYLTKFCKTFTMIADLACNMEKRPFWTEGDKYEEVGKELYNMKKPTIYRP